MKANATPDQTYPDFYTTVPVGKVARKFRIDKKTLKRWWVVKFGLNAYQARVSVGSPRLSDDERKRRKGEQSRRWYLANPERVAKYRQTLNRETKLEYNRNYYASHAERLRSYSRSYRLAHKDDAKAALQTILRTKPAWLLFQLAKKRAKRNGLPFELTLEYIQQIIPRVCPITLLPFERGKGKPLPQSMTLDKVIPELGYIPGNVLVVSRLANTIKQTCTDPAVFDRLASYLEGCL